MTRTGEPSVAELMAQLAANAAEIAALKAEKEALSQRLVKLEEELALARLHRFAPRSEKHIDRLFNEAEEAADENDRDYGDDVADLPDTGLPASMAPRVTSGAAGLYQKTCRASVSNTTLVTIRRRARAAKAKCIAWARPLPSNSISRSRQRSCRMCGSSTLAVIATAPGPYRLY